VWKRRRRVKKGNPHNIKIELLYNMSKPFIPRDKPKSWVLFICAGLIGLLAFGPVIGLGIYLETNWLRRMGVAGFFVCWCVMAVSGVISVVGGLSGRYRNLEPKDWKDQVW
jgi:hypothetical protein